MNNTRPWQGMSAKEIEQHLHVTPQEVVACTWCPKCYQSKGARCIYRGGSRHGQYTSNVHSGRRTAARRGIAQELYRTEHARAELDKYRKLLADWLAAYGDIFATH